MTVQDQDDRFMKEGLLLLAWMAPSYGLYFYVQSGLTNWEGVGFGMALLVAFMLHVNLMFSGHGP